MYKYAQILSMVIWAVAIAVIVRPPTDLRRTVHMLKDTRGKSSSPFSSSLRNSFSGAVRGFQVTIHPRDHRAFSSALDPGRLSFVQLSYLEMPATLVVLPESDDGLTEERCWV
jgi:hypothetical protein